MPHLNTVYDFLYDGTVVNGELGLVSGTNTSHCFRHHIFVDCKNIKAKLEIGLQA